MNALRILAADGRGLGVLKSRWEYGSQFHWQGFGADGERGKVPWQAECVRLGCGRDALRALVDHLRPTRLWFPSYLCQELVTPFVGCEVDLRVYGDSPLDLSLELERIPLRPGDAVLIVNHFGLASRERVSPTDVEDVTVIEDHTHGPCSKWAHDSQADYCFASLRKSTPIPDGAVLWSPRGRDLPKNQRAPFERSAPVHERLSGMLLKSLYLQGYDVSKSMFRELLDRGEQNMADGPIAVMSPLSRAVVEGFPFEAWRCARRSNFQRLKEGMGHSSRFEILEPVDSGDAPFAVVCVFRDADECTQAQASLVARDVYPSRLWPLDRPVLEGIPPEHGSLSRRTIALPCDGRYGPADVDRVLDIFAQASLL